MDELFVRVTIDGVMRMLPRQVAEALFNELLKGLAYPIHIPADRTLNLKDGQLTRDSLAEFLLPTSSDERAARQAAGVLLGRIRVALTRYEVPFVIKCANEGCKRQLPIPPERRRKRCDHEHAGLLLFDAQSICDNRQAFLEIEGRGFSEQLREDFTSLVDVLERSLVS